MTVLLVSNYGEIRSNVGDVYYAGKIRRIMDQISKRKNHQYGK